MQIFCRYSIYIGCSDFLNLGGILVQPVQRVAVEFVGHALGENFVGRVEAEDERIENGVFGMLNLFISDGLLSQSVDVFVEGLNGFDGALALGAHSELQDAGMPEVGTDAA